MNAKAGTSESMAYKASGAGAAVGGGVSLIVGLALVGLDLSRPTAPLYVGASGNGVVVSGGF